MRIDSFCESLRSSTLDSLMIISTMPDQKLVWILSRTIVLCSLCPKNGMEACRQYKSAFPQILLLHRIALPCSLNFAIRKDADDFRRELCFFSFFTIHTYIHTYKCTFHKLFLTLPTCK